VHRRGLSSSGGGNGCGENKWSSNMPSKFIFYFITGYRRDAENTGPEKVLPSTPSMGIVREKSDNNNYSCEPTWNELDLEVQRQYIRTVISNQENQQITTPGFGNRQAPSPR
jgi:hypothetical protein